MSTIEREGLTVTYNDSPEAKERAWQMLVAYYTRHEAFNGETIQQCDAPNIDAPMVLSEIAEKAFEFVAHYTD